MKKYTITLFTLGLLSFTFSSCKKKQEIIEAEKPVSIEVKKGNHTWYYFNNGSFKQVDKIQNAPFQTALPWTEAVRISSANNLNDETEGNVKAFAVVNRLGILTFDNEKVTVSADINLFNDRTAGNLVFLNNTPLFSVYKSSFFNDTITDPNYKSNQDQHLFLVQFDDTAKISYPVVNCNNISEELNSEVTDFIWDGLNFTCSIKSITDTKNSFSYVSFKPNVPLLSLSPATTKGNLVINQTSVDTFRKAKEHIDYKNAPERIKGLVSGFSTKLPFCIEVKNAGGISPRVYANKVPDSTEKELQAKAILSQSWSAALFEDGTLFIEGALPGKHILRNGKPVAIRLPKLPAGFIYSDFVISGTTMYVAWEESSFYKVGRSGFLEVNLDKTLYSKLL